MNHTATINIWKQSNRVSRLWEDLAANCVAPDPHSEESTPPPVPDKALHRLVETGLASFPGQWEELPFVERVGRESIQMIKHAMEVLTAPPEEVPVTDPEQEKAPEELENSRAEAFPTYTVPDLYPAMIKVPFEAEPQPTSVIETRRIIYGLKIPARPLHKRPIYQRLLFCLRGWIRLASRKRHDPSSR